MTSREAAEQAVRNALAICMEHWECVQIVASRVTQDGTETEMYNFGGGNYYARRGMMNRMLAIHDESDRVDERHNAEMEE